jgi:hypothetical protein
MCANLANYGSRIFADLRNLFADGPLLDLENKESVRPYTSDRDLGYGYSSEDGFLIIIIWLCQLM